MHTRYDLPLIGATLFLLSWGTVMIYSTGGVYADLQYNDGQYFLYRHLIHMLVGLAVMGVALIVNYHKMAAVFYLVYAGHAGIADPCFDT